jgi:hypothetical protein
LGETLSAEQAKQQGLVTKILPSTEKFQEQLFDFCKTTAGMSTQVSKKYLLLSN